MTKALHLPKGAQDWDLTGKRADAEAAAEKITAALREKLTTARKLIAAGADPLETARLVRDEMYVVMDDYTSVGARTVEPETTLVDVIEHALDLDAWTLPRKD